MMSRGAEGEEAAVWREVASEGRRFGFEEGR